MKKRLSTLFIIICLVLSVFSLPVQAGKLNKKKLSLKVGQTKTLKLKDVTGSVKWSSTNKEVCKVKKGKVTAVAPGTATVKAKNKKKTYKCVVTVTKKVEREKQVIGNINSKVYHSPACTGLPFPKNRVYIDSWQEAERKGYRPCGNCHGGKSDEDYYN